MQYVKKWFKDNKENFCTGTGDIRKARENVGPLLNEVGDLVTKDMEKAVLLNAFFTLVITSITSLLLSLVPAENSV